MIGVFDSGLGGLTVAKEIMRVLPGQKIIYLGDTARAPYGNKSPEEVAKYALENTQFLLKKKAKMIVIGCNTASAVAGQMLRKKFSDIPVLEVITPAVREALRVTRTGRVGVIGTRTTIQSGAYERWCNFRAGSCPLFVPLVEAGHIEHTATQEVAQRYLKPLKDARVDTLILGCTHYLFLKSVISRIMGDGVQLVDSAQTVAKELAFHHVILRSHQATKNPVCKGTGSFACAQDDKRVKHEFYVSKITPKFRELAEKWLDQSVQLKLKK